jgi:hypothetical protein
MSLNVDSRMRSLQESPAFQELARETRIAILAKIKVAASKGDVAAVEKAFSLDDVGGHQYAAQSKSLAAIAAPANKQSPVPVPPGASPPATEAGRPRRGQLGETDVARRQSGGLPRVGINDALIQQNLGPFVSDSELFAKLGRTPGQRAALQALQQNKDFAALWNWLVRFPGGNPIRFCVKSGLSVGGTENFGGYLLSSRTLAVDPTAPEHRQNPQELVDTLVHELVHAVLDVEHLAKVRRLDIPPRPFGQEMTDLVNDPKLKTFGLPCRANKSNFANNPKAREYMQREYGDPFAKGAKEYTDQNRATQQFIARIVRDNVAKTHVGSVTSTGR